jgi:tetratricopeptide (TPR) repeat protein
MHRNAWRYYRQGNLSAAAKEWRAVFDQFPASSTGREALGIVAEMCDGRFDEALALYQFALEADPKACSALYRCANLLETKLGDPAGARAMFEQCAALGDVAGARRAAQLRAAPLWRNQKNAWAPR